MLFIKASSPVVEGVLQNPTPRVIMVPSEVRFPTTRLVQVATSPRSVLSIPCPSPRNVPSALSVLTLVPVFWAFITISPPLLIVALAMKLNSNWGWGVTASTLCPMILPCSTKNGFPRDSVMSVVVVVVLLPVVEADTELVVDAKIITSVKIVAAAAARYVLFIRGIFLLLSLLFSIFIFVRLDMENKG